MEAEMPIPGASIVPGATLYVNTTPVTVAASPLLSSWINTEGFTTLYAVGSNVGGTSAVTVEWGFDGAAADADFTATVVTVPLTLTPQVINVIAPFMRLRWAQTVADSTKSKIVLRARA